MTDLVVKVDGDLRNYQRKIKGAQEESNRLQKSLNAAAKGGAIAFAGLTTAIGLAVNEAAKFETITTQFEVLTGSAKEATRVVEDLQKFSASTPFQFEGIAKAGQQLLAFGFTVEEMNGALQRIGDVSAATGKPLTDLAQIFGQVSAAGKLTGERLNQLQEAGVPIGSALAKTMGVAEQSIRDLVSQGEVDFKTFEKAFNSLSEEGGVAFRGMEKRSETLQGKISTLKDNVSLLAATAGKDLLPAIKLIVGGLITFIQKLQKSESFISILKDGLFFTTKLTLKTAQAFEDLGSRIGAIMATVSEVTKAALNFEFKKAAEIYKTNNEAFLSDLENRHEKYNQRIKSLDDALYSKREEDRKSDEESEKAHDDKRKERKRELTEFEIEREKEINKLKKDLKQAHFEEELEQDAEFQELRNEIKQERREEELEKEAEKFEEDLERAQNQKTIQLEAEREFALEQAKRDRENKKQEIKDTKKHGKVMAKLKSALRSEEAEGLKSSFGELEALHRSHNNTLKSIGKVAAIANIVIKTAESAMNIYNGFSTIPIVGPALGIAGAAAAVAFGAERISTVQAANAGGFISGNALGPNRDSVLTNLTPGEFVTPRQNANEVIEAAAEKRIRDGGGAGGVAMINVQYDTDEAEKIITVQQNEARALGIFRSVA